MQFSRSQKIECGVSISVRSKTFRQPKGGYVPIAKFNITETDDECSILVNDQENSYSLLINLVIGELARRSWKKELSKDFADWSKKEIVDFAYKFSKTFYSSLNEFQRKKHNTKVVFDENQIHNVQIMVNRSIVFFEECGHAIEHGFKFSGGYTKFVNKGLGDFMTEDTIWKFMVLNHDPTKEHILQMVMQYLMGKRSTNENLHSIKNIGIFNPRLNRQYVLKMEDISEDVMAAIEKEVIGYSQT